MRFQLNSRLFNKLTMVISLQKALWSKVPGIELKIEKDSGGGRKYQASIHDCWPRTKRVGMKLWLEEWHRSQHINNSEKETPK